MTANAFTKPNYTFAGWALTASGDVAYSDGAAVKNLATSGTVTLYAKWTQDPQITVTFNANGGTGNMAAQVIYQNVATALNENTFSRTGYTFNGWNTRANGTGTAYADKQDQCCQHGTQASAPLSGSVHHCSPPF